MTTVQEKLLHEAVSELNLSKSKSDKLIQAMIGIIHMEAQANVQHPGKYDDDGNLVEKWCSKHQMYHEVEHFPKSRSSKDGLYSHCRFAERRAKYYSKKVKQVQEQVFKDMTEGIEVNMTEVNDTINKYKILGKQYNWEADSAVPINGKYNG